MKDRLMSARERMRGSATSKVFFMGFLILILMIPTIMVRGLIFERRISMDSAITEVTQKWGGEQTLSGPIMVLPYLRYRGANPAEATQLGYLYLLPDVLYVNGKLQPEVRSRGIYDVPLYAADLKLSGAFSTGGLNFPVSDDLILWDQASINLGISDMRGIQQQTEITFNEEELAMGPGVTRSVFLSNGVHSVLSGIGRDQEHSFEMDLKLNGGKAFYVNPMGRETQVKMTSSWKNPSFDGAYLPTEHNISDEGFEARWAVLDINRDYPQQWTSTGSFSTYKIQQSRLGLKLFMPVDVYQQTTRSVKYALLFIALTFLAFFLAEVLNKLRVHPIQYLLIGFAIVLFYLLLLSLSEHIAFGAAYIIASVGIVGMVSLYSHSVLKSRKLGNMIGLLLAGLYVFLYFLLQMEDMALLLGSIGLFVILGAVMYLTRNIDWYAMKEES